MDDQLNAYLTADREPDGGVYKFPRDGFNHVGAPVYRWNQVQKISREKFDVVQVGQDGSFLSFDSLRRPDGTLVWSYPIMAKSQNRLEAARPDHVYRINSLRGVVTGPGDLGDVFQLGSVDGTTYLLTRADGLFIGRVFQPNASAPSLGHHPGGDTRYVAGGLFVAGGVLQQPLRARRRKRPRVGEVTITWLTRPAPPSWS